MQVFLAYSFRDQDRDLVAEVDQLLESHGVRVVTGEYLAGEQLTPAVQQRIESADGLIALLTRRDELANGGWTTHAWVQDELNFARNKDIHAVPVVEKGINVGGMYAENERIDYDRENPLAAFLHLSHTIALWKNDSGRLLTVQIQPDDLALQVGLANGGVQCRYRLIGGGPPSPWKVVEPFPDVGGTFIQVGVSDNASIQLEISMQATRWVSEVTTPWPQIELKQLGGMP